VGVHRHQWGTSALERIEGGRRRIHKRRRKGPYLEHFSERRPGFQKKRKNWGDKKGKKALKKRGGTLFYSFGGVCLLHKRE